jgi:hypothetical protein
MKSRSGRLVIDRGYTSSFMEFSLWIERKRWPSGGPTQKTPAGWSPSLPVTLVSFLI